jgi:hypothetical protein
MPERLSCAVPFCRHTIAQRRVPRSSEWICAKHWLATSKAWRRRLYLFRRRGRFDLSDRMWLRLKDQAIERAGGIT